MLDWYTNFVCGDCLNLRGQHRPLIIEYCGKRKMKMDNWNKACKWLDMGPQKTKDAKLAMKENKDDN